MSGREKREEDCQDFISQIKSTKKPDEFLDMYECQLVMRLTEKIRSLSDDLKNTHAMRHLLNVFEFLTMEREGLVEAGTKIQKQVE